jgi:hypothetical protein
MGLGTAFNILGSEVSGSGERASGRYNKKLLYQRAKMEEQAMERETELATKSGRRLKASQYASYAKSGAVPTSGTPLLAMVEQSGDMQRDILENRRNRMIQAAGYRHQGDVALEQAKQASRATRISALTQELGKWGSMGLNALGTSQAPQGKTLLNGSQSNPYGEFRPQMNTIAQYNRPSSFSLNTGYGSQVPQYLRR